MPQRASPSHTGCRLSIASMSLDVVDLVNAPDLHATVESAFAEACNLVTGAGQRFSLVTQRVGDGPRNVVLNRGQALCLLEPGDQLTGDGRWLVLSKGFCMELCGAHLWNPRPDYQGLTWRPAIVYSHLAWLKQTLPLTAPHASLAARPAGSPQGAFGSFPAVSLVQARADELVHGLLAAYRHHNLAGVKIHARQLAGLGPGLTPAGDDWLAGWLIGLYGRTAIAPCDDALPLQAIGKTVVDAATGRTTGFSLSHLTAAAEGIAPWPWHALIDALAESDPVPVREAAAAIMRRGATSGADMLAGFLAAL